MRGHRREQGRFPVGSTRSGSGSESGATGAEYAILIALVAAVVIVAVAFMGREVRSDMSCTASAIDEKSPDNTLC